MKKLTLTLAALGLLHTAQADVAEANVTLQLKLQIQQPESPQGKFTVRTVLTSSYKTTDFIFHLSKGTGRNFTNKARLIARTGNSAAITYLIREKGKEDLNVTQYMFLDFADHVKSGFGEANVIQSKIATGVGTGTYKNTGHGLALIGKANQNAAIELQGPLTLSYRFIEPVTGPSVGLIATTASLTGIGSFDFSSDSAERIGVAQGSFKITGAKIISTP